MLALQRIIRLGWQKFSREKSSSSAAFVVSATAVFMASALLFLQGMSSFLVSAIESSADVSVYFTKETQEENILLLQERLIAIPEVKSVSYVSQEKALEDFTALHKNDEGILQALEAIGANPLLSSLRIVAKEPREYPKIAQFVSQEAFDDFVERIDYQDRAKILERINTITKGIQLLVLLFSIGLASIAFLVAFNTIRLTIDHSREEIEVMRLVGASNFFIEGPFVVQGVLVGIVGALFTFFVLFVGAWFAGPRLEGFLSGFHLFEYFAARLFIFLVLNLAVGIGLGVFSSLIAIQRYLRI